MTEELDEDGVPYAEDQPDEALREEVASGDLHRDINRRAAEALGKPTEGEGSSWHDIPEEIGRLKARVQVLMAAIDMAADDELFFSKYGQPEPVPCVICSDTFSYATADAEQIAWEEIPDLQARVKAEGWPAAVRWVAERRKAQPLPKVVERMEAYVPQKAEIERLQQHVNDLQSGMYINCVYCGHRYGPKDEVPATMADVLKEHIEKCAKHPMSALKVRLDEAGREIEQLRDFRDNWRDHAVQWRGLHVEDACQRCHGSGIADYANTSTWHHGIGGNALTKDVCEMCWGSGDKHNPWPTRKG